MNTHVYMHIQVHSQGRLKDTHHQSSDPPRRVRVRDFSSSLLVGLRDLVGEFLHLGELAGWELRVNLLPVNSHYHQKLHIINKRTYISLWWQEKKQSKKKKQSWINELYFVAFHPVVGIYMCFVGKMSEVSCNNAFEMIWNDLKCNWSDVSFNNVHEICIVA